MCENPVTHEGQEFACRVCNDCISTRKNLWVARCMAEKATMGHALLLTLTYRNNADGSKPDGAKAFCYQHVQTFLKKVREEYYRAYEARNEISYIVAGERGSKKDRVHWHMVIFSKRPLIHTGPKTRIGQWFDFAMRKLFGPRVGKKDLLDHWSLWDHGTVDVHEPDQAGMAYVVKYALKDMFNAVNSRGTAREAKAEKHAASYFRMSKVPPIGFRYLVQKCDEWESRLVVPVNVEIPVPEYSGYWYPTREQRSYLLQRLHDINEKRIATHGKQCAQWSALLSSVEGSEKDWEALVYGQVEERPEEFDARKWQDHLGSPEAATRKRCGGILPCARCYRGKTRTGREALRIWYADQSRQFVTGTHNAKTLDQWYRAKGNRNPFCGLSDTDESRNAFGA